MTSVGTSTPSTVMVSGIRVVPSASSASGSALLFTVNCSATCFPRVPFLILWPMPTEDTFGSASRSGPRVRMYCFRDSISLSWEDAGFLGADAVLLLLLVGMTKDVLSQRRENGSHMHRRPVGAGRCPCERPPATTHRSRHAPHNGDPTRARPGGHSPG